nr:DJ-1/PfpI family protein [Bacteroidota bacterium]
RLGSPNFHEIPINRPVVGVHNNQRDGHMRMTINKGKTNYEPNTLGGGCPFQAMMKNMGFASFLERIDSKKIRSRSKSFLDHFSQATLFFQSQSPEEQTHIINAFRFELTKVQTPEIRERMVGILTQVDKDLANEVAAGLGIVAKVPVKPMNHSVPADENPKDHQPKKMKPVTERSEALSMKNTIKNSIVTRKVAFLVADGVNSDSVNSMKKALEGKGAMVKLIAPKMGFIKGSKGEQLKVDETFLTASSVVYDAVFIPDGVKSIDLLMTEADALHFINEAYKHCKPIAVEGEGSELLKATYIDLEEKDKGIVLGKSDGLQKAFVRAISQHRFWERESARKVPA